MGQELFKIRKRRGRGGGGGEETIFLDPLVVVVVVVILLLLLYLRCSKYGRVFTRICPINEIYYLIRVDSRWR